MAITCIKTVEVGVVDDGTTTLFVIPAKFLKRFPPDHVAEFHEGNSGLLLLTLEHPMTQKMNKRYKVVRHKGSGQVSLPRYWLRDRAARQGDQIQAWWDDARPDRLLLRFVPQVSNPRAAHALQVPDVGSFRRPGE